MQGKTTTAGRGRVPARVLTVLAVFQLLAMSLNPAGGIPIPDDPTWDPASRLPTWRIPIGFTPQFSAGYTYDSWSEIATYGATGLWAGMPRCSTQWVVAAPSQVPDTSGNTWLSAAYNLSLGRFTLEKSDGASIDHWDWVCYGETSSSTPQCTDDLTAYPIDASTTEFNARNLPSGWSRPDPQVGGRPVLTAQTKIIVQDLSVGHVRGGYQLDGIPFTGRVYFTIETPYSSGYRTASWLFGHCTGESPTQKGAPIGYDPILNSVTLGAMSTSGEPLRDVVPIPPVGPAGDWTAWIEACNVGC